MNQKDLAPTMRYADWRRERGMDDSDTTFFAFRDWQVEEYEISFTDPDLREGSGGDFVGGPPSTEDLF